jgi:hypothetical protein
MKPDIAMIIAVGGALCLAATPAPKPQLMVLGLPHFGNPGRDIANTKVEDVLAPRRQREIEALVDRLATFRPNHVAIEWETGEQAKLDARYADYRAGRYKLARDEDEQIGFRLAAKLGLPRVDAVDWNQDAPGKDEDYDFPGWLKAHGRGAEWDAYQRDSQAEADAQGARQRCTPIADWVRDDNGPEGSARYARPYFTIATFGDETQNPGAAWVGAWYARNLRIYHNLLRVGGTPGSRTVAIFGAGHGPWLRADAEQSGRFTLVDALRYLPPPAKPSC